MARRRAANLGLLALFAVAGATLAAAPVQDSRPERRALVADPAADAAWPAGTAGAAAAVREVVRTRVEAATAVAYTVTVSGFVPGQRVHVWMRRPDGVVQFLADDVTASRSGLLVSHIESREPFLVLAVEYAVGEAFDLAIVSADRTVRAVARGMPFPAPGDALAPR
jgi:hypothetical protein